MERVEKNFSDVAFPFDAIVDDEPKGEVISFSASNVLISDWKSAFSGIF